MVTCFNCSNITKACTCITGEHTEGLYYISNYGVFVRDTGIIALVIAFIVIISYWIIKKRYYNNGGGFCEETARK